MQKQLGDIGFYDFRQNGIESGYLFTRKMLLIEYQLFAIGCIYKSKVARNLRVGSLWDRIIAIRWLFADSVRNSGTSIITKHSVE